MCAPPPHAITKSDNSSCVSDTSSLPASSWDDDDDDDDAVCEKMLLVVDKYSHTSTSSCICSVCSSRCITVSRAASYVMDDEDEDSEVGVYVCCCARATHALNSCDTDIYVGVCVRVCVRRLLVLRSLSTSSFIMIMCRCCSSSFNSHSTLTHRPHVLSNIHCMCVSVSDDEGDNSDDAYVDVKNVCSGTHDGGSVLSGGSCTCVCFVCVCVAVTVFVFVSSVCGGGCCV